MWLQVYYWFVTRLSCQLWQCCNRWDVEPVGNTFWQIWYLTFILLVEICRPTISSDSPQQRRWVLQWQVHRLKFFLLIRFRLVPWISWNCFQLRSFQVQTMSIVLKYLWFELDLLYRSLLKNRVRGWMLWNEIDIYNTVLGNTKVLMEKS